MLQTCNLWGAESQGKSLEICNQKYIETFSTLNIIQVSGSHRGFLRYF